MNKKVKLRPVRKFSTELKRAIVAESEKRQFSVGELGKFHDLHSQSVYKWIYSIVELKSHHQ